MPGIIAAKCGAKVTLSDSHRSTDALQTCHANLRLNNINDAVVLAITWGHISPSLLMLSKVDLILGSDCFYDSKGNNSVSNFSQICQYVNFAFINSRTRSMHLLLSCV